MAESHFERALDEVIDEPRSARLIHSVPRWNTWQFAGGCIAV